MISESKTPTRKRLRVVAALIIKDGLVFSAERDYGFLKGKWEFPGGKIERGETPKEALKREIKEELGSEIAVGDFLMNVVYEYPEFTLDMDGFVCSLEKGRLLVEKGIHSAERWTKLESLSDEDFCPADQILVKALIKQGKH